MKQATDSMPRLPLIASGLLALGLTGCSVLSSGQPAYPTRYTLDTPVSAPGPRTHSPTHRLTLDLRPVNAPGWLDSKRMLYRLAYRQDSRLAAYTQSAWADTPARLVGDNLEQALTARHLFSAVLGKGPGQSDLTLQVQLNDFSQHFADQHTSRGRIVAQATLLDSSTGTVIAQKRFEVSAPAPSADATGGVQALTKADGRLDQAIADWLSDTLAAASHETATALDRPRE